LDIVCVFCLFVCFLQITLAIIGYSLCSSTLLLANKMVIEYLPLPSVVSFIQIISSAVAILVYKFLGGNVDGLEWSKLKAYSLYIVAFVAAIYANMQALAHSNVETVIVFRACSPIAVTVVEYFFMDRAWPSFRSSMSLLVVAIGAVMYCTSDSEFALKGFSAYYWVVLYFFLITFEMTYGKKLTSSVKMESIWGPVLYCNLLAALPMFLLGYVNGDYENLGEKIAEMPGTGAMILLFSCVAGTLIGYTGWLCRSMVSATTYTLVGVVNKFLTVLLNTFMWDKHSSPFGIFAVCVCLLAGTLYQQAPKRDEIRKAQTPSDVEDQQPLVRR
jgi:GDP-mannose transporter